MLFDAARLGDAEILREVFTVRPVPGSALKGRVSIEIRCWLVVSKIFYVHPYLGKIPNLTNIFQRG